MQNALPLSLHRAVWSPLDLTFLVFAFMTLYSLPYTVLMMLLIQLSTFPPIPYVSVNCFFPFIPAVLLRYLWQCNPLLRMVFLCIFSCLLMLWSVYFFAFSVSNEWCFLPPLLYALSTSFVMEGCLLCPQPCWAALSDLYTHSAVL